MIWAALIVLLASFIRSVSGFGYALVATTLLTLVIDAKSAVVLTVILGSVTHLLALFHNRRHIEVRRATLISLGTVPGSLLGAYILAVLDASAIKLAIAILVIPFSVRLLLGHSHPFRKERLGCTIAGFAAGAVGASTSFSGPPLVLFLLNQGLVKQGFVGTIAVVFLVINVVSFGAYSSLGMVKGELLLQSAVLLPALVLGSYLGSKVLPRIDPSHFRKIASAIVSLTALVIIASMIFGG